MNNTVPLIVVNAAEEIARVMEVYGMGTVFMALSNTLVDYRDDKLTPPGQRERDHLDKIIAQVQASIDDAKEVERLANED